MGTRGPRSASDLATYRPNLDLDDGIPVNMADLAHRLGSKREAERALRRAERVGETYTRTAPDGTVQWFRRRMG